MRHIQKTLPPRQVAMLSIVTELCNHHHYISLEHLGTSFYMDMYFQFSRSGTAGSHGDYVEFLNELWNWFLKWLYHFNPITSLWGSQFFYILPTLIIAFFILAILVGVKWYISLWFWFAFLHAVSFENILLTRAKNTSLLLSNSIWSQGNNLGTTNFST